MKNFATIIITAAPGKATIEYITKKLKELEKEDQQISEDARELLLKILENSSQRILIFNKPSKKGTLGVTDHFTKSSKLIKEHMIQN